MKGVDRDGSRRTVRLEESGVPSVLCILKE